MSLLFPVWPVRTEHAVAPKIAPQNSSHRPGGGDGGGGSGPGLWGGKGREQGATLRRAPPSGAGPTPHTPESEHLLPCCAPGSLLALP